VEEPGFIPAVKSHASLGFSPGDVLLTTYADPFLMGN
jgi:hypothetical protein